MKFVLSNKNHKSYLYDLKEFVLDSQTTDSKFHAQQFNLRYLRGIIGIIKIQSPLFNIKDLIIEKY